MGLLRTVIDGKPATVAYLTELGGEFTTPEKATIVMVRYDDGVHQILVHAPAADTTEPPAPNSD